MSDDNAIAWFGRLRPRTRDFRTVGTVHDRRPVADRLLVERWR